MVFLFDPFWFQHLNFSNEPFHYLRFEKDTKYYEFRVTQDLLGDWIIILNNGRIKSKLGQSRTKAFSDYYDALNSLYLLLEIRLKKWYQLKECLIESLWFNFILNLFLAQNLSQKPNTKDKLTREKPINKQVRKNEANMNQLSLF